MPSGEIGKDKGNPGTVHKCEKTGAKKQVYKF